MAVTVVKAAKIRIVTAIGWVTRIKGSPRDIANERRKFSTWPSLSITGWSMALK
jgi:hypothetical protein